METIKIRNRIANIVYHCTKCDGSSLTKEAFEKHKCEDYPKEMKQTIIIEIEDNVIHSNFTKVKLSPIDVKGLKQHLKAMIDLLK